MARLAQDEALYAIVSNNPGRFVRSKSQIGGVYVIRTRAEQLRDWLRKLAERAGFIDTEYEYITIRNKKD